MKSCLLGKYLMDDWMVSKETVKIKHWMCSDLTFAVKWLPQQGCNPVRFGVVVADGPLFKHPQVLDL